MKKKTAAPDPDLFIETSEQLLSRALREQPGETIQIQYYPTYPLACGTWKIVLVADKTAAQVKPGQNIPPLSEADQKLVLFLTDDKGLGDTNDLTEFLRKHCGRSGPQCLTMTWSDILPPLRRFVADEGIPVDLIQSPGATYTGWRNTRAAFRSLEISDLERPVDAGEEKLLHSDESLSAKGFAAKHGIPLEGSLPAREIAKRFGLPYDATRKQLERCLRRRDDCYTEVSNPRPTQPKYLYEVGKILDVLDKLLLGNVQRMSITKKTLAV